MRLLAWGCMIVWLACAGVRAEEPRSGPGAEAASPELTAQVERWLSEGVEASVASSQLRRLGEAGTQALIAIFERDDAPRYVRLRALSALGGMEDAVARAYLHKLVRAEPSSAARLGALHPVRSPTVLRRALSALAENAPADLTVADVAPCLEHRDAAVRRAAVRVLSRMPGVAAKRALQGRADVEPSPQVKRAIHEALSTNATPPSSR